MPTLLLVRHGCTSANSAGILAGWTPGVGLDNTGKQQVARVAERLADLPLSRVVSSPLQRCQETTTALIGNRDVSLYNDDRLGECHYGSWTGGKISELAQDPLWRSVQDYPSMARFPESPNYAAESLREMYARAVDAARDIDTTVAQHHGPDAVWVAVSHGDVIKAVLADALGIHLDGFQRIMVRPASLSAIRYTERRSFIVRMNDTAGDMLDLMTPILNGGDATPGGETGADSSD